MKNGLLVVGILALGACDGANIVGAPPLTSGPASNTLFTPGEQGSEMSAEEVAEAVCRKLVSCQLVPASQVTLCVQQAAKSMIYLLDTASFISCFEALSCAALSGTEDLDELIVGCIDLDPNSLTCTGNSLTYCSNQGLCKDLPCTTFCSSMGLTGGTCVADDEPHCKCKYDFTPGGD